MKKLMFFVMTIILISGTVYVTSLVSLITKNCNKELVYIVFNKGVFYEIHPFGKTKGFCGTLKDKLADGYIHSIEYKKGKRNGITEVFLESGKKVIESHYKDNKLNGKYLAWDSQGRLRIEATYKNGVVQGMTKKWNKSGQLSLKNDSNNSFENKNINTRKQKWMK